MSLTSRETWALLHGVFVGGGFLLAFAGGLAELWGLRPEMMTSAGLAERVRRVNWGTMGMALIAWFAVITGTFIVYPWYRAAAPQGADLAQFPKAFLIANPNLAAWHTFGMEWKEHVAWLAPILATAVAFVVAKYGTEVARNATLRRTIIVLFTVAFLAAGAAGLFGALITKAAPVM